MGTLQSWRKAYGALKDTTKVGLVRVNSDYADLDVAIVKATNHVECPPKDRHLRKIFAATAVTRARADPEGAANHNHVIQYALALVLKESFKVYCAINDGIINLIDKFFEMPKHEAVTSLEIYKRAGQQARSLSEFYEACKGLELARNFQFPVLREPPQSFLTTMEEYIKEAPRAVDAPAEPLLLTYRPDDGVEDTEPSHEEPEVVLPSDDVVLVSEETEHSSPPPPSATTQTQNSVDTDDLLGLNTAAPDASAIEDQNALALAIISTDGGNASTPRSFQANDYDPTGWELALVTTPSNDISAATDRQLAGGLDTLTLNSLYDDGAYIASQRRVYGAPAPNPFEVHDPFATSNGTPPPQQPAVNNPFGAYQPTYQQHQLQLAVAPNPQANNSSSNPFGDFGEFPVNPVSQQPNTSGFGDFAVNQHNNPFRSTGLI
ncbi:hypothetical protein F2Q70_00002367 [Brassica cretica]|uniref:AP180 N-terminal homology (ANTH) domain-containing protein n=1 Tax=Brassica cretica TaxID=69181 RepID=A0A8S9IU05_BRACR|nr:hypothetical protein F2Q70_00002367 [Brassica cretica]